MTWVKLCGMARRRDVEAAVGVGADAVGFVVAPVSPRCVPLDLVAGLGAGITIDRFLLTVDADPDWVLAAAMSSGMSGVQPHGANAAATARLALSAGLKVLFPIPVMMTTPSIDDVPGERDRSSTPGAPVRTAERVGHSPGASPPGSTASS